MSKKSEQEEAPKQPDINEIRDRVQRERNQEQAEHFVIETFKSTQMFKNMVKSLTGTMQRASGIVNRATDELKHLWFGERASA